VSVLEAEDHHAPRRRRGGGCAAGHRERRIGGVKLHPRGAVARGERLPGLVLPARGDEGEVTSRPYYGYFPMRYFSEYEYGATLTQ